jgi:PAS domain S-box-containing protein
MADVATLEDPAGRLLYVSPSAQQLMGFTREELLGTPIRDLIHPDDRDRVEQAAPADLGGGRVWEVEFRCRTRDGPYRRVAARSQTLPHASGQPSGVLRWLRDITEQRDLEEQALRVRKLEAVARLAGGLAHDFNNLLTVISGYTSILLQEHGPDDPDHEALYRISRAADRTAGLIRQLLAFAGRQMLHAALVDLNAIILHLTEVFKRLLGPSVRLHLNLHPSLPRIKADPALIEQALLDLATNARDAMPSGGQFSLSTSNVTGEPSGRPAVRLTVSDSGCGMDADTLAHLFEPFFTTKEVGQGTGLGLSTVYGIIQQCGGEITVSSRPNEGTTFTMMFPAAPPEPEPGAAQPAGATILLVDDEDAVRRLARHVLQMHGYTVLEACHAEEALEVHAQHPGAIDLLVSDVVLPHLAGLELARRLAAQAPELRILFLSGCNKDDADLDRPIGGRRPHFLAKPFRPVELIQAVREALHESRT